MKWIFSIMLRCLSSKRHREVYKLQQEKCNKTYCCYRRSWGCKQWAVLPRFISECDEFPFALKIAVYVLRYVFSQVCGLCFCSSDQNIASRRNMYVHKVVYIHTGFFYLHYIVLSLQQQQQLAVTYMIILDQWQFPNKVQYCKYSSGTRISAVDFKHFLDHIFSPASGCWRSFVVCTLKSVTVLNHLGWVLKWGKWGRGISLWNDMSMYAIHVGT